MGFNVSVNEAFKPRWWNFGKFPPSPHRLSGLTVLTVFSHLLSLVGQPALSKCLVVPSFIHLLATLSAAETLL